MRDPSARDLQDAAVMKSAPTVYTVPSERVMRGVAAWMMSNNARLQPRRVWIWFWGFFFGAARYSCTSYCGRIGSGR
jgi:hypothetical protein